VIFYPILCIFRVVDQDLVVNDKLRGQGGSQGDGSSKLILLCFLKEESERYLLFFTSSKNIDPSQSYGRLKVSAYV
jgi:hypothetical protein